jgi:hypothetical protein
MNFDKYQKEVQHLMHMMRTDFKSISVERFDDVGSLVRKYENFHHFQQARHNSFEKCFGFDMARWGDYIFMVKQMKNYVVYIEVEVDRP